VNADDPRRAHFTRNIASAQHLHRRPPRRNRERRAANARETDEASAIRDANPSPPRTG
jgi:hypothetical protein